jgi:signal transduction histidine kinase
MHCKNFLLAVFCIAANCLLAQNDAIQKKIEAIKKSDSYKANIIELKKILETQGLTEEESLEAKSSLINQYQELQQWDNCLNYCQEQITLAQQQKNSLAEATFYKLIGITYYHIQDKARAIEYWKKCIAVSETHHHNILLEQCYHNIGSVILERANFPEAEKYFQKAIQLSIANKTDNTDFGILHYRVLATLYTETKQLKKAAELYQTVIAKARQLNDSVRIADALMFYALALSKGKKFEEAIKTGKEALLISQKIKKLDLELTALGLLSYAFVDSGNYKAAYQYLYAQGESYKKRFNTDLNFKIGEAEAKFKNAETTHEKETAVLKAQKEKQVYIASIFGLLIAAGAMFFYLNQKRKYNKKIEQLKMQQQVQEEKERLSRDLHDNLGSQLALLSNSVEQLDTTNKKQQEVGSEIDKVKNTSKQLLQTLRETIWILNKEEVSAEDFFDKLVEYTTRYLQSYPSIQLSIDENLEETKTVNSNHALQLFRICQEAINNACKYSGSEILTLKGISSGDEMQVLIEDKGIGFDISSINTNDHYGLLNMKQRAASIGALLKINAEPGKGTSVSVHIKT